jgi:hypothetical protein
VRLQQFPLQLVEQSFESVDMVLEIEEGAVEVCGIGYVEALELEGEDYDIEFVLCSGEKEDVIVVQGAAHPPDIVLDFETCLGPMCPLK